MQEKTTKIYVILTFNLVYFIFLSNGKAPKRRRRRVAYPLPYPLDELVYISQGSVET